MGMFFPETLCDGKSGRISCEITALVALCCQLIIWHIGASLGVTMDLCPALHSIHSSLTSPWILIISDIVTNIWPLKKLWKVIGGGSKIQSMISTFEVLQSRGRTHHRTYPCLKQFSKLKWDLFQLLNWCCAICWMPSGALYQPKKREKGSKEIASSKCCPAACPIFYTNSLNLGKVCNSKLCSAASVQMSICKCSMSGQVR